MERIHSFPPVADKECKILILGSMPGIESLKRKEYYGHPRNSFWKIIFALTGNEETEDYSIKKKIMLDHNIALWDVISNCRRPGSLDSDIHDDEPNDFRTFFKSYPNINFVFFNGTKAYETYRKKVGFEEDKSYVRLPSTSPAHAINFMEKLESWKVILKR